ncbi:hypothetical protein L1987_70711 [Smallanthus sonchifolius]|uniref:Uncharacterized protein n=1 Tax=Smallanthus sonchifolius TaxID=185202 RepID=A0ACB9APM8_9ASTR|nr:hypothetical protein L1987_70711 [Smallanthus sonchifolius]
MLHIGVGGVSLGRRVVACELVGAGHRIKEKANLENLEAATSGQGMSEGKRALYRCNYCDKDASGKIRLKCACCPDFDLCVECFSVGVVVYPHKNNHPFRVMDDCHFHYSVMIGMQRRRYCYLRSATDFTCVTFTKDEMKIVFLQGLEMYGPGNWNAVAELDGTKSKSHRIEHYNTIYMNSPCFPLPDMSHVMGKNREELLAMARGHTTGGELSMKEESPFSARIKVEDLRIEEGPSMSELSGYNYKRQEFGIEYDNEAEGLLADMEFTDTDTDTERQLKLRVLRIYSKRDMCRFFIWKQEVDAIFDEHGNCK